MKFLLLNPPYVDEVYDFKQEFSVEYSLGLAYLAGMLESEGLPYDLLDANALGYSRNRTVEAIVEMAPDVLGITSTTTTIIGVSRIAELVKQKLPAVQILLGGPHATAVPERSLQEFSAFDVVFQGDGEMALAEYLHSRAQGQLPHEDVQRWKHTTDHGGIWYRHLGEVVHLQTHRTFGHLNDIPLPSRAKMPNERYRIGPLMNAGYTGKKLAKLAGSRGCPYQCNFCSEGMPWPPYRARTPENIYAEIKLLYERDGARHFYFVDDTINVRAKDLLKLSEMIVESGMKIVWHCHARVKPMSDEILAAMKRSGCFGLMFGVESGNKDIIKNLGKNITLDDVRKGVALAKKYKMKVLTFFMFGHIGDTATTCQETIDFACELNPDLAFFSMVTPYPGTEVWDYFVKNDAFPPNFSWEDFKFHVKNGLHHTPTMTGDEIWHYYNRAHREFYLRPRYIGRVVHRLIQRPREVQDYWYLLKEFFNTHEWIPSPINPGNGARA